MGHVKVPVHLLERPVLVSEVAALAVRAESLSVKLSAVLRLIFVIGVALLLITHVEVM